MPLSMLRENRKMAGEDFLKFNNGQKFSFSNFKEIKEEYLKNTDAETKRLFNIFAGDDHILQASEAQSLWNKIQTAATTNKKGDNSVFDNDEMQRFLKKDKDIKATKTKFSIDALMNMISQVFTVNETQEIQQPVITPQSLTDDDLVQYTSEEIENISVQTLSDDVSNARKLYDTQNNEQGSVSDLVNATKENFDTEFASSRVGRYIRKEELCVDLLERSKSEEGLSQKEYLEAKINFVISLIQNLEQYSLRTEITQDAINISLKTLTFGILGDKKTKNSKELEMQKTELERLKLILARLKPEEINSIISQLLSVDENPKTLSAYNMSFGGKTNIAKSQTVTRVEGEQRDKARFSPLEYEVEKGEGSLASLSQAEAYKKMSFEEVFQEEREVEYNSEDVMDYTKKESYMQFLLGIHNRREQLADILKEARFIKTTRDLGSEQMPGEIQNNARKLMVNLNTALKTVYGNDTAKIQEFIDSIYPNVDNTHFASINQKPEVITNEQGEFVGLSFTNKGEKGSISLSNLNMKLDDLTIDSMISIADKLQSNINATYDKALNDKTIEEYGEEVKQAYIKAYGSGDSQSIANAYIQSQQEGVGYVKTGVSTIGMVVMIAAQFIPVGGQVATLGGLATATLGSSAITATELLTKEGKVTKEEWQELAKEVVISLALTATGMKIGKISEGVYLAVAKHCPKLIALAAEIGSDATMSLIADLAITGQIDITGEGIAQLQGVLVGILHAKGNFRTYLDTHAGDVRVKNEANNMDVVDTSKGKTETVIRDEIKVKQNGAEKTALQQEYLKKYDEFSHKMNEHLDIPKKYQTTWQTCKLEIASIMKQIKDGTLKFDKAVERVIDSIEKNLKEIANNVSDKVKMEINKLIDEFRNFIRQSRDILDMTDINKQLENIKNADGSQRYSKAEIEKLLNNIPSDLKFTKKEIVDIMSLKAMTVDDAIALIGKIDTVDKFKLLNTLASQKKSNGNGQTYNYFEIDNFFDNIADCKITNMYEFFGNAINDFKCFGKNVITKESYLNELSYHLKSDKQAKIYNNILLRIKQKKCKMLPAEVFKYLDLKNETGEVRMYNIDPDVMKLHTEIKNKYSLDEERELLLAFIDDKYVLEYLKDNLGRIGYWESIALLKSLTEFDGTLYSDDLAFYKGNTKLKIFYDYAEKNKINIDDIEANFYNKDINSFQTAALPIDMELAARFSHLREYIGKGTDSNVKNYLYNNLYLKTLQEFGISSDIISKLDKINNEYNVKIMISSNLKEIDNVLEYVEAELSNWYSASKGSAKMPPVIDFNSADADWYDSGSTQINTASGAYSSPGYNGSLAFNKQTLSSVQWSIRHEMTHSNDLKQGINIDDKYLAIDKNGSILVDKYGAVKPKRTKELVKELLKAGIGENHIDYAFINTMEFIAVASEGDMSKYSIEFKEMLIEFGMPNWMFNMKPKK